MIKISLVLSLYLLLVLPCEGQDVMAWRVWKQNGTVCGQRTEDFPELLENEIENHQNEKRKDVLVVEYSDFRCCMKKTWVNQVHFEQKRCIRQLLGCFIRSDKTPCILDWLDYAMLIFADNMIVLLSLTVIAMVITFLVLRQMHQNYYS